MCQNGRQTVVRFPPMGDELILWRRHLKSCDHRAEGREYTGCRCPVWCDGTISGQRIRRSMDTLDWDRAERRLARILDPEAPAPPIAIATAIRDYVADCHARNLSPATIRSYEKTLEHFRVYSERQAYASMQSLTLEAVTGWRQSRAIAPINIAPTTQRKEIEALRAFFAFALERSWLQVNWARKLKPPQQHGVSTLPFEQAEVDAILRACEKLGNREADWATRARKRARAFILLLLYSGLRISDAAKLERSSLNVNDRKLFIRKQQKTGTPVYVRLPESVVEALLDLEPVSPKYFFWRSSNKLSTCVGLLRRMVDRVLAVAGITGHPHRFRDTFAVRMLEHDVPIRTVQILLGHTSVRTTEKHYAPFVQGQQRLLDEAVGKLDFGEALITPPQSRIVAADKGRKGRVRDAHRAMLARAAS